MKKQLRFSLINQDFWKSCELQHLPDRHLREIGRGRKTLSIHSLSVSSIHKIHFEESSSGLYTEICITNIWEERIKSKIA